MLEACPGSPSTNYVPETQIQKTEWIWAGGPSAGPAPRNLSGSWGRPLSAQANSWPPTGWGPAPRAPAHPHSFPGHWEHLVTVYLCFLSNNTFIKEIMFLSLWDKTQINLEDSGLISWFIALLTSWMFFNTSFFKRNYENHIYYAGSLKMFLEKYQNKNRILKPNIFSIFHGTSFKLPCLVILNKIILILV